MKELLERFENKQPEIVFEWSDSETDAKGWVVINSLRGGAAGGGTRMRKGLDKREVESLAKTMEIKFTVAGPPIGGAKSGINFDPKDIIFDPNIFAVATGIEEHNPCYPRAHRRPSAQSPYQRYRQQAQAQCAQALI